ncbi:carbohydrate-binding domain-containing protein [Fibrobacter sp.]|uniref:carbohydrate-binding domain-containing protein n=1 Tax=Fibrobacter sp. TaxID=35828 RepID=UPI0025C09A57|nr:carbohydrate-binding domain-containing protein [Fibrobacter sp.]MBR2058037.1 carbohydrate-binding domain-containing protein [Fibrobacter sp.]MBR4007164.1 carbohydrate-binding domain-containing protein [Fibrobacter sp.]
MKLGLLAFPAIGVSLGLVACSEDAATNPNVDSGALYPPEISSSSDFLGTGIPGVELSSSSFVVPGIELSSSSIAGPGFGFSSSSFVWPGPVVSSSSVVIPGGNNPGNESGDDENDNEDSRTLDGSQILLKLAGTSATVENNNGCVEVADKVATITCPGAYYVTGESSDFQVVVNTPGAENEGNTGIYLHNATIKSSNSPILVKNADKTVIHLVKGTTNVVEDGNGNHLFTKVNGAQDTSKAAIYSRDDLNIKGAGTLIVKGKFKNGIQCSNDLKIKNGNITVEAEENAIKGKGSLQISGGVLNVTAKKGDGLESDECEEAGGACKDTVAGKGIVEISGGNITIKAGDDGIQAANYILVNDSAEASTIKVTSTGKGMVATKFIYVNGGDINVTADDDAMHTKWRVYMNAGNVTVSSKDDGIHADSALYLKGSTINVVTASEGLEAYRIFAEGGITSTFATNDGWNGAGGPKENVGQYAAFSESGGHIVVSGGYHYISAKGDMIDVFDANGSGKMTGGVLILEITGQSYENQGGFNFGGWGGGGMGGGMGGGSGGCSSNMAGGLIDTDAGFEITGGVLLAFGNYSTDLPKCATVTYNNSSYYGSNNAAFKPTYQGNAIIYGGSVQSVTQVNTAGMQELKFPNGVSYMYK